MFAPPEKQHAASNDSRLPPSLFPLHQKVDSTTHHVLRTLRDFLNPKVDAAVSTPDRYPCIRARSVLYIFKWCPKMRSPIPHGGEVIWKCVYISTSSSRVFFLSLIPKTEKPKVERAKSMVCPAKKMHDRNACRPRLPLERLLSCTPSPLGDSISNSVTSMCAFRALRHQIQQSTQSRERPSHVVSSAVDLKCCVQTMYEQWKLDSIEADLFRIPSSPEQLTRCGICHTQNRKRYL
jgi:hypothetical protein